MHRQTMESLAAVEKTDTENGELLLDPRFAWFPVSQDYEAHLHVRSLSVARRQIRIASSHFTMQTGYTRPNATLAYMVCLLGYMHQRMGLRQQVYQVFAASSIAKDRCAPSEPGVLRWQPAW
jgi:hypothetical protein